MGSYKPVIEHGQVFAPHFSTNAGAQGASSWFSLLLDGSTNGCFSGRFKIWMGRWTSTAFSTGFPKIKLQGQVADDKEASDLLVMIPSVGASIAATTSSAAAAGAATITVGSGTNIAQGDRLGFLGNGGNTPQIIDVKSISTNVVTPVIVPDYAISNLDTVCDQAESWDFEMSLAGLKKIRLLVDNMGNSSSQTVLVRGLVSLVKAISDT